jgi:flagellar M-ring protein FliF
LQGVRAALRHDIVQPESRLLPTEQGVKSTASVFVDMGGGRLEIDQVNAIRHLVANAVQGLAPDQVAVVDNRGRTLSEDLKQDPMLGNASSQMRFRQQVEDYFSKKVESMPSPRSARATPSCAFLPDLSHRCLLDEREIRSGRQVVRSRYPAIRN